MVKPTGKLLFAYQTIASLEQKLAALKAELATVKKVAYGNMELLEENAKLRAELERRMPDISAMARVLSDRAARSPAKSAD